MTPTPRYSACTDLRLLHGGDELFPAMASAINAAQEQVLIATYIWLDDPGLEPLLAALLAAAGRGVRVRLLVDGFGSRRALPVLRERMRHPQIRLMVFRPVTRLWTAWLRPNQLRRLHQKLCVIDDTTAFVGGINLLDDRHDLRHGWSEFPRLDFAVAVQGPVVAQVEQGLLQLMGLMKSGESGWWRELLLLLSSQPAYKQVSETLAEALATAKRRWRQWRRRLRPPGPSSHPATHPPAASPADQPVASRKPVDAANVVVPAPPPAAPTCSAGPRAAFIERRNHPRHRRPIEQAYISAIEAAQERIALISPYFYPSSAFLQALQAAARRGVQVRLLMQGRTDYRIAADAARAMYPALLPCGVAIFEYQRAFLHAKIAVIDGRWSTVGSSNIDPISMLLNLEANLAIHDAAFAADLEAAFEQALKHATPVTALPGVSRGPLAWLRRALLAWVARVYLGVAGAGGTRY
ncbi:cardiolipin synthase ClsB [Amphibiibacter pelophylacis]|uniref:Cardiolipin synthase ClsB n=1 Tax=Amphibiibacter pelophylacis TaxID=1799477 RepID=A0ACC6P2F1_9BURK